MRSQRSVSAVLLGALLLSLLLAATDLATAQEELDTIGETTTEEVEQPPEEPPAEAAEDTEAPSVPFYIHPLWLVLLAFAVGLWIYLTSWANADAKGVGVRHELVATGMLATGAVGLLLALLIHGAFAFLMLALVSASFTVYVIYRNRGVPERHKLFGAHHRAQLLGRIPVVKEFAGEPSGWRASSSALDLNNSAGTELAGALADRPALAEAAEVLRGTVLQGLMTQSQKIRVFGQGDQFIVQHVLDGVPHNVEALDTELGQQLLACASIFLGFAEDGRIRSGKSELSAELPGDEQIELHAQIKSTRGRPVLTVDFPDWTAGLHREGLSALGVHDSLVQRIASAVNQERGAVIVASPARSGRTTTLFACAGEIDIFTTDVIALGTPEQHAVDQIRRWPVPSDRSFDDVYQEVLREVPDALVFDDIREQREASCLLDFASQEGRLLASVRASSAPAALVKLAELAEPEVVARATVCVTCQRLIRKLCTKCREAIEPDPQFLRKLKIDPQEPGDWYRPVGCDACMQSGYRGRIGLFSMLILTDEVKAALTGGGASAAGVREAAGKSALRTMHQDGINKAASGLTTLEEVQRVLKGKRAAREAAEEENG